MNATHLPSADQRGSSSRTSGVLVRLTTSPPSRGTAYRSHSSFPPLSCSKMIQRLLGDQVPFTCRSSDCASCTGHAPLADTFQRFSRPVRFVVREISFPSGD